MGITHLAVFKLPMSVFESHHESHNLSKLAMISS